MEEDATTSAQVNNSHSLLPWSVVEATGDGLVLASGVLNIFGRFVWTPFGNSDLAARLTWWMSYQKAHLVQYTCLQGFIQALFS